MNQIKKMYITWGILVIGLFSILLAIGIIYKNKVAVYKDLEAKLVDAEKRYIDEKFLYPEENETLKTNASILISNGYLDNLEVNGEVCEGYAEISKKNVAFDYKGYIDCGKYKTKGYNK